MGMISSQGCCTDGKGLRQALLCFSHLSMVVQQDTQVVPAHGHVWMVGAKQLVLDAEDTSVRYGQEQLRERLSLFDHAEQPLHGGIIMPYAVAEA